MKNSSLIIKGLFAVFHRYITCMLLVCMAGSVRAQNFYFTQPGNSESAITANGPASSFFYEANSNPAGAGHTNDFTDFTVSFTQQPVNTSACLAGSTTFTVGANGTGTLTYQWQESTDGGTTWSNVSASGIYSGVNTVTLALSNINSGMNGYRYQCVVTDASGSSTSNAAILTVNAVPMVQTTNLGLTICAAGGGSLTAQFFSGLSYQWQSSADNGSTWSNITDGGSYAGAATDMLVISNAATLNGTLYRYVATSAAGCSSTSAIDTLHVLQPVINNQPVADTVCTGGTAVFSVGASSPVALTYQWQLGATNLADNAVYSGVTTSSLTISNVTAAMDRQLYRVAVRDTLPCLTNSNQVRLFVIAPPTINTQPQNVTTCAGLNVNFTVNATSATATGLLTRTYQWQTDNGSGGVTWSNITPGGTAATLPLTSVSMAMHGYRYRVIVSTGSCGSVTSSVATLTVRSSGTWLGAVDTNWHVAGNWCGGVPVSTTDVLIPDWAPRMPTISNTTGIAYSRSLTIESNAKLTINGGSTSMSGPFDIQGTVAYIADADQPILPADHGSLEINGSGNKILQTNTGIYHDLALGGSAKLVTGNYVLTMRGGSNPITGASFSVPVASWIVTGNGSSGAANTGLGGLRFEQLNGSKGTVLFPIGPTPASYNPAQLSNTGTTDNITIAVNDQPIPGGIVNSGIDRTWLVSEATGGGSSVSLELGWAMSEEGSMFNRARSEIIRSNGTSIVERSAIDSAAGLDPYSRSAGAFTTLTQFSVASYTYAIALPIPVKSFVVGHAGDASVTLFWETGDIQEPVSFMIQRSTDNIHFSTVANVTGDPGKTLYTFTDKRLNTTTWYRLQVVSAGRKLLTHTVMVTKTGNESTMLLRPSVVTGNTTTLSLTAAHRDRFAIRLLDLSGRVLLHQSRQLDKGRHDISIAVGHIVRGVYYLYVTNSTGDRQVLCMIKQ